jgi:hypothetical protein
MVKLYHLIQSNPAVLSDGYRPGPATLAILGAADSLQTGTTTLSIPIQPHF